MLLFCCTSCEKQKVYTFDPTMETFKKEKENIRMDAEVSIPDAVKTGTVTGAAGKPLLLNEKVTELTNEFFAADLSPQFFANEKDSHFFSLETSGEIKDWAFLGYNDSCGFIFNSESYAYYENCIVTETFAEEFNADLYKKKENLDFLGKKQAAEQVRQIFKKYGISLGEIVESYAMEHEIMAKNEDLSDKKGNYDASLKKDSWSSEDDTYLFYFRQVYHEIPVIYNLYTGQGFEDGEEAVVMFNKSGVVGAGIEGCYEWTPKGEIQLISLEEAAGTFFRNYQGIINTDYQVEQISLMMDIIPGEDFTAELRPVWVFDTKVSSDEFSYSSRIVIDAANGEELTA